MSLDIRPLTEADAAIWRELRVRMLREHPDVFGSSYEEAVTWPVERFAARLREAHGAPDSFLLGAFEDGRLVGSCGLAREPGLKDRHKAFIWGVYAAPEVRGSRVGRTLMEDAIRRAREIAGLEQLILAVAAHNEAARGLYASLGFETYGREPRALKLADRYVDEDLMVLWLGERP